MNPEQKEYANFWIRSAAYILDMLIIALPFLGVVVLAFLISEGNLQSLIYVWGGFFYLAFILGGVIGWLYWVLTTVWWGGSLGKRFFGLKVVDLEGKKISFWRAAFRYLIGYQVSGVFLGLGFLWILKDEKRQGWHDQVSDTYVLREEKNRLSIGLFLTGLLLIVNLVLGGVAVSKSLLNPKIRQEFQNKIQEIKEKIPQETPEDLETDDSLSA